MAELDVSKTTTTNVGDSSNYEVSAKATDAVNMGTKKTYWDFPNSQRNIGYYKEIPELKKAIDALATWTAGKGYTTQLSDQPIIDNIIGMGKDNFQTIIQNMLVMKKVIGDAFAEIIKNDKGTLVNIKPISAERMRIIVGSNGIIEGYEQTTKNGVVTFSPNEILHFTNDRIADEIHGTSVIDACKWVIDCRNEAMTDYRKVLHRNVVPVRIIEIDTDDTAKRNAMITEYEEAIRKGEVLVIPKGTVEIKDNQISIQDPITWIQYLENFFYQAVGIPKIILGGSEQFTEASSKVGYLTFEQVYMKEQRETEAELWNQLGLRITFERPVSLKEAVQESEAKNTGQVGFQPKEAGVNLQRE